MLTILKMIETDLDAVLLMEQQSYPVPWTRGIFEDCLRVNYPAWVLTENDLLIGYILFSVGADEAHLLNICISPDHLRQGYAKALLLDRIELLKEKNVHTLFLEVRASSKPAIALYEGMGFKQMSVRKDYYKTVDGREDALTYKLIL